MNRNWFIQPRIIIVELLLLNPIGSLNWFQNGLHKSLVDLVFLFCLFCIFKLKENVVARQMVIYSDWRQNCVSPPIRFSLEVGLLKQIQCCITSF